MVQWCLDPDSIDIFIISFSFSHIWNTASFLWPVYKEGRHGPRSLPLSSFFTLNGKRGREKRMRAVSYYLYKWLVSLLFCLLRLQTLKGHFQILGGWRFNPEMTWQPGSSLRDFDMILSHSYKPVLEWEALGKSLRVGTQHLQQQAGVCASGANNSMINLASKMGGKLLSLYH